MEDYGRHTGPRVGKMGLEPGDSVEAVDLRGDAARDFDHLGELLETLGLVRPDEAEQGGAAIVERGIDGVQIAAATLDDRDGGGRAKEGKVVSPKVQASARADFEQPQG